MPTPQTKVWNLGFKTASATYSRLQSGVGEILTDRKIAQYARRGYYGDNAKQCQEELDAAKKPKSKRDRLHAMVDDLAG